MPIVPLAPLPPPYANEDHFAIVVGINHYRPGIQTLSGAINDCTLFCEWLVGREMGGLNPANVTRLTSVAPGDPIRNQIEDRLLDFYNEGLQHGMPRGRRLYLFFAGHGLAPPPSDRRGCALLMADSSPMLLRGLLGLKAADGMRLTGLFKEVMLVMDCCAEATGPSELACFLASDGDAALPRRPYLHIQAAKPGAATAERELEHPLDTAKLKSWQGVLTHALLRGLTTAADATGTVTAASLKKFLEAWDDSFMVEFDRGFDGSMMTFGAARGVPVKVTLNNGAARFQVREGINFTVVVEPRQADTVRLAPGQYLFDALDGVGRITRSEQVPVRDGGIDVQL